MKIDGQACSSHGITIHNCDTSFELNLGEQVDVHVSYVSDYKTISMAKELWIVSNTTIMTIPISLYLPIDELPGLVRVMTVDKDSMEYQFRELVIIALYAVALCALNSVVFDTWRQIKFRRFVRKTSLNVKSSNEAPPVLYRVAINKKIPYDAPQFPSPKKISPAKPQIIEL